MLNVSIFPYFNLVLWQGATGGRVPAPQDWPAVPVLPHRLPGHGEGPHSGPDILYSKYFG